MSLTKYKQKRDFNQSPEPVAGKSKTPDHLIFVIQRHKASRLHYDLRLELDGVLKSWAVPKGPSMNSGDKRLAMMVEDHPYDYKDFAGVIPSGYGAGIVEIWDNGTYIPVDETGGEPSIKTLRAGLKAGNLKFNLKGKKLKGEFALVKIKGKEDNVWLLIKHRDKYAVDSYDSEDLTPKNSPINKWLLENKKATSKPRTKIAEDAAEKKKPSPSPRSKAEN
jgi:bifunctional non-homologous end joining protein LigD